MKQIKVEAKDGLVLFVDTLDNDIIYASTKTEFEEAIIKRQSNTDTSEITIKVNKLTKSSETNFEDIYTIVDNKLYELPISRIQIKAFKIDQKSTGHKSL